ncbi:MAG: 6-carboxytetrahydropterin synthase QueD [Planctomycetes bacterium]|nr:6-carboxytetrahydropterin synthase QueD [Planctomycetota bacterium]
MRVSLRHTMTFDAAHRLIKVPADHKCARLHGHTYSVDVVVEGDVDPETGWLIDFGKMKEIVEPLRKRLDHYYLNEIEGLENPTAEVLAKWIWDRVAGKLPILSAIEVRESCQNACVYRGG